ncbi:Nitrate transporter 1.7 [Acorus calamus]|uniref:Nitrate transporter 1.7 n=1 Tax=Acorus calamus TaxID=4465 RepID=A0AAV9C048_ACOCL|nr:Nitrate transporter 1.7 [Acorus calamus]
MERSYLKFLHCMKCFPVSSSSANKKNKEDINVPKREPGGWRSMLYVIGNETFERLATFGLLANFMVYLVTKYHMKQVLATNVVNIWSGTTNFAPLIGAFLSDTYWGRFRTLAYCSVASFLGMVVMTLTASIPNLLPPGCSQQDLQIPGRCIGPNHTQLAVLFLSLLLLTIGASGIRPCSLPFGVDQFDATTEKGRKDINSFFNWYYFTFTFAIMIAITVVVYVQDSVSWALGLGIPTLLMSFAIVLFFLGTRLYVYVPPEGSVFSGIGQVFIAAYKNRGLDHPTDDELYDPPARKLVQTKLPLTQDFRHHSCHQDNHPHLKIPKQSSHKGARRSEPRWYSLRPGRLCSIQQVEEVKCLIRIVPIWASGVICFTAMAQQSTITVLQAMKMDRHLGPHFRIPVGSLGVFSMLAMTIWIPIYDRLLVPTVQRFTHKEGGITLLQRMGIGMVIASLSMVVAGIVEEKRRSIALSQGGASGIAQMSVMWLIPQLALLGIAEAFNGIGQTEFFYKQFPEHMRSFAGSLFFCSLAGSNYLSSLVITLVHKGTGGKGRPNWLADDINVGKVDYFYYLIAIMGIANLVYFIICARWYRYKGESVMVLVEKEKEVVQETSVAIEINSAKDTVN